MELDLPNIERIEQYLNGQLSAQEKTSFEAEMDTNGAFREQVLEHIKVLALSKEMGKATWRKHMQENFVDTPLPLINNRRRTMIYALAACIVVLALIGGMWLLQNKTVQTPQSWIAEHVETPPAPEYMSDGAQEKLGLAYYAYNQGKYKEAEEQLQQLSPSYEGDTLSEIYFFRGMSLYQLSHFAEAIPLFSRIEHEGYKEMANWFLGLSYVQSGELKQAGEQLQGVVNEQGYYQTEAKELLELINNL